MTALDSVAQYCAQHTVSWAAIAPATLARAKEIVARCNLAILAAGHLWHDPHVSSDAEGGISFEWWNEHRSLTIFVHPDQSTSYLFAWGLDMWTEMETGDNPDDAKLTSLWCRLNGIESDR